MRILPNISSYFSNLFKINVHFKELLDESRSLSNHLNKTPISLSEMEAQLLSTLVASHSCKKFVEIGTLTGYSALWILHGLREEGELFTFEKDDKHARAALQVFNKFHDLADRGEIGFKGKRVHLYEGAAEEALKILSDKGPFDGVFIDGNKSAYDQYLNWAEANLKKGGIIIGDNIFLKGAVWGDNSLNQFNEKQIKSMQNFNMRLADSKKYTSTIIPTNEGMFFAVKNF